MASEREIRLPDIGGFEAVDVVEVLVKPGDRIKAEDPVITLESDKATMEVPSPSAGVVKRLLTQVGDKVSEGSPLFTLEPETALAAPEPVEAPREEEKEGVSAMPMPSQAPARLQPTQPPPSLPPEHLVPDAARSHASPSVRKLARELGVDLAMIQGSARKGRILREDVKAFAKSVLSGTRLAPRGTSSPDVPSVDFSKFGDIELAPLSRIKRIAGENLSRAWMSVPHVTQFDEADITELEAFRKAKLELASGRNIKLTLLAFIVKAASVALREFPAFNASLAPDGEALVLKKYVHIGVAVNTDGGLLVPVIRDVDKKGVLDLAAQIDELSRKARQGKVTPAEMQGGCFTVSSLGGVGGTGFTPIINVPEVAILGVSRSVLKPVYRDGQFVPRLVLPLALSYDHRVIDGVAAARFSGFVSNVLSDIRDILL
ncbi:MAG: dihydrolipoyllysine-residue acetyltransferase [Gammaproteobacteria bacterium]